MIRKYITAIIAALAALGGGLLYLMGRKDADDDNQIQEYNEYIETRKRMDAAGSGDDAYEWLRERAKQDGDL